MHVATVNISQPQPLDNKGNLSENWNKWKQNFKIYLIASGIQESDRSACALFLHTIGQHGRDIYNKLDLSDIDDISLQNLYQNFDKHCNPKSNLTFNRYQFFNTKQGKQPFDNFLLSLKQKSKNCEFGDLCNSLIMTQIIAGISNKKLQERLFLMNDLDLEKTIQECRAIDLAESHVQQLPGGLPNRKPPKEAHDAKNRTASDVKSKPVVNKPENKSSKGRNSTETSETTENKPKYSCRLCGTVHVYGSCPAFGTVCKLCDRRNHFASVCKNK